jgi:hypothetical protein
VIVQVGLAVPTWRQTATVLDVRTHWYVMVEVVRVNGGVHVLLHMLPTRVTGHAVALAPGGPRHVTADGSDRAHGQGVNHHDYALMRLQSSYAHVKIYSFGRAT